MVQKTQVVIDKAGFERGIRRLDIEISGDYKSWGSDGCLGNIVENVLCEVFGSEVELILPDY